MMMSIPDKSESDNQVYYFKVGKGKWEGNFQFRLTDKDNYKQDPIGLKNRFLVRSMLIFQKLFGKSKISSEIKIYPEKAEFGTAKNVVRIHKFGLTMYLLKEEYFLNPNGKDVRVVAKDRFGPIPFLFTKNKEYPAKIYDGGYRSTYWMPLLGAKWECKYFVKEEMNNIDGQLTCAWGESSEIIHRVGL